MSNTDVLLNGKERIGIISNRLSLDAETEEKAIELYEQAWEKESCEFTGRGVKAIAGGVVLIATREIGDIRTTSEIANETGSEIDESTIHQTMKYLLRELELGLILPNPKDFVDYIATTVGADSEDVSKAKQIVSELKNKEKAQNQSAQSLAATVLYHVGASTEGHGKYTQSEIANAADISTLTVRTNYKKYEDIIKNEIKAKRKN